LEINDQQIRQYMSTEKPVTVRCYGVKDISFPNYVLMLASGIILAVMLLLVAHELLAPQTGFGFDIHPHIPPWVLNVALWTPPCVLLAIAVEVVEGVIAFRAFRKKFRERFETVREKLELQAQTDPVDSVSKSSNPRVIPDRRDSSADYS
jgi:hypothetical protein